MTVGATRYQPLTKETVDLARTAIRKLKDQRRRAVREIDQEIDRIEKMITDAGLDPYP